MKKPRNLLEFSPDALLESVRLHSAPRSPRTFPPPRIWAAFSGGLDSTVLLHALAARRDALGAPLHAVHVNHGLHPDAARWALHCQSVCDALDVPMESYVVTVDAAGIGVEAAARDARYDVLRGLVDTDELLLTAQHQDDQLETFLLQALRGAGPHGLAAMPPVARLGGGWLLRPLLEWPRSSLERWAKSEQLDWLVDPANADEHFDRNYLRRQLVPLLKARWPAAGQTLSRSARHCAEAALLMDQLAAADLAACGAGPNVLAVSALRQLDAARRRNVLRHWLDWSGFPRPSERKLEHVLSDVLEAGPDTEPCVTWADVAVRRYRDGLYVERVLPQPRTGRWSAGDFALGEGWGSLQRQPAEAGPGLPEGVTEVRYRSGGEKLRLAGREHHHELKKLCQEAGVLPWRRVALPLVYVDNTLAAVGDLWINADIATDGGWRVAWRDRPQLIACEDAISIEAGSRLP